ncbi:hypothetical protein HanRHA438_Chr17g0829231 [Helianthus annuus]|nr:hypothetical protein HanRHA438_Chr17g0829231 [Helianthus annuus]
MPYHFILNASLTRHEFSLFLRKRVPRVQTMPVVLLAAREPEPDHGVRMKSSGQRL